MNKNFLKLNKDTNPQVERFAAIKMENNEEHERQENIRQNMTWGKRQTTKLHVLLLTTVQMSKVKAVIEKQTFYYSRGIMGEFENSLQ